MLSRFRGCALVMLLLGSAPVAAQIATDDKLGDATVFEGPHFEIPSGAGVQSGDALFFSFLNFGVPEGGSVTFTKDPGAGTIDTVVSRVTGGTRSDILGSFHSELGEQHFYFLNPWGVFFGSGSSLDVDGSFHVSTADEIRDANGGVFSARAPGTAILGADPRSFGFLSSSDRGSLEIRGEMVVERGATLDLVGGAVTLEGALAWAPGGLVRIASLGSAGEVIDPGDGSGLEVIASGALGAIEILDESIVSVSGFEEPPAHYGPGFQPLEQSGLLFRIPAGELQAGDVEIGANSDRSWLAVLRGPATGNIHVRGGSLLISDSDLRARSFGTEAGSISVDIEGSFEIRKQTSIENVGILARSESMPISHAVGFLSVGPGIPQIWVQQSQHSVAATGAGAQVRVDAGEIRLFDGARISATTFEAGSGGQIEVRADDSILIRGRDNDEDRSPTGIYSNSQGTGDAGSILVETGLLQLDQGGGIFAQTTGNGNAGDIVVDVERLEIRDTSQIDSSTSAQSLPAGSTGTTSGMGGNVTVRASDSVLLSGGLDDVEFARLSTFAKPQTTGSAGSILVETPLLEIEDGAGISATTSGAGAGGDITLDVGELRMTHAAISAESTAVAGGAAGSIQVGVDGGLHETSIVNLANSRISAFARSGPDAEPREGNIDLLVRDRLELSGGSVISSSVETGLGGSIRIGSPASVILLDESAILATTEQGTGGEIRISTRSLLPSPEVLMQEGRLSADAGVGTPGVIELDSPELDLESGLKPLEAAYLDAASQLRQACAARAAGEGGSFTVARRRDSSVAPEVFPDARETGILALVDAAGTALAKGDATHASALLGRARDAAATVPTEPARLRVLLRLADAHAEMAGRVPAGRADSLLAAHALLGDAAQLGAAIGDRRSVALALGRLGALYEIEQRVDEALVLTRRARREAEAAEASDALARLHWQEGRLLWAQGRGRDALLSHRRAVALLEETRQESLAQGDARAFRETLAPYYLDLVEILLDSATRLQESDRSSDATAFLLEARVTMERLKAAELRDYFRDECVAAIEARTEDLDRVLARSGGRAAIVYPILLPDRLELLVTLPSGLVRRTVRVGRAEIEATADEFRNALFRRIGVMYRPPARRLHDWLVEPYREDLDAARIDTLVFVPDGILRTIPLAALHDGEGFLIERRAVAIAPGLSLVDPTPLDREGARLLLAGVSQGVQGLDPLPKVPDELAAVHALFGGEVLLDEDFAAERFERELRSAAPSVVHVASHAQFTGDPNTSFLLAWDGKISLDDLSRIVAPAQYREHPIELLLLSACETAAGDERAALGLAGAAIRAGARSAVGSLWNVGDEVAFEMVLAFYQALQEDGISKAQALRRAQLELLRGDAAEHPFYWSPYVLVSNWM
jgi:filamentous hemagglutinin family protein